ncbi:hypothetical protein D033_4517B, partial [Vibrio parahaemolyticus B-265]
LRHQSHRNQDGGQDVRQ